MAVGLRRRLAERWGSKGPYAVLALIAYLPALLTKPGVISADTKVYLYLDPGRLLQSAVSMWDPDVAMGTVTHQTIGYLFPMGPFFWLTHTLGIPVWVGQRLWLGSMMFLAGAGVVYLLRTMRWRGPGVAVAGLVYLLSPYLLNYAAKHSVVALPWVGLPWLIAFVMRSARHGGWRDPALFALWVAIIGGVNATALTFVLLGALLWLPFAVWVHREVELRRAIAALGRMGLLTFLTSTWWLAGLWAQGRYGINVLRYTETAQTVASASTAPEVLRGLGYWFFYGKDKFGNFVDMGVPYTQHLWLLATSFALPALGILGGAIARFRDRAYFVTLLALGTLLSVGAFPWSGSTVVPRVIRSFLTSSEAGSAMRSMPRAAPLLVLGLAVLLGAGVTALHERLSAGSNQLDRRVLVVSAAIGLVALVNFGPGLAGGMVAGGLERPGAPPSYWKQDAAALQAGSHQTRVLELPGSDFASYRWNGALATTVDPITPGLITRPYVARELVPYGTPQSANMLVALDSRLQQGTLSPQALAPMARFMSAGTINLRTDITYERYRLPRPRQLWDLVTAANGLGTPRGFGSTAPYQPDPRFPMLDETSLAWAPATSLPQLAAVPVTATPTIVHAAPVSGPVLLDGDANGFVDASAAGLLDGSELVLAAASSAGDPAKLARTARDATLLVTDTNRRAAERWGTLNDEYGYTEMAGEQPLTADPSDQRLDVFPGAGDAERTVAEQLGGVEARATGYGNPISYTPEDRAANAVDGDPSTAWQVGAFGSVEGERLQLDYDRARTTDHIQLLQSQVGVRNRFITKVKLTFDDGDHEVVDLTDASRSGAGERVTFPRRTFNRLTIEILDDTAGHRPSYQGLSPVGFSEVAVGDGSPVLQEAIRLPTDLLSTAGADVTRPLAIVLTRQRVDPSNPVRRDPEPFLSRTWDLPAGRAFAISGSAHVADTASVTAIDQLLGLPTAAAGGIDVRESRHLPGSVASRATAAIDGDPTTAWTTGFGNPTGDWVEYRTGAPLTIDHLDLTVVADGRHSVPTRLDVTVDGTKETVAIPTVADDHAAGSTRTVRVTLPHALTGSSVRLTLAGVRAVDTRDWYSEGPIALPVAVADWGVPGLQVRALTPQIDARCRSGLLTVDGVDVPVSLHGTSADAVAGKSLAAVPCIQPSGLALPNGRQTLASTPGRATGLDVDQLVLRSAAGGAGDPSTGPVPTGSRAAPSPPGAGPSAATRVTHQDRTSIDVTVSGVHDPQWLVLGQSLNAGWHATANGHDLGTPTLINGYANGWQIGPGTAATAKGGTVVVHLRWTPQGTVDLALWISAVGALLVLGLILWPMRHRLAPVAAGRASLDRTPSVPRSLSVVRSARYGGPRPTTRESVLAVLAFTIGTSLVVNPIAGVVTGALTLACVRFRRARPLLTVGAPLCLVVVALYYLVFQLRHSIPVDFNWPMLLDRVHALGWMAVVLLLVDVVVDRLWLRRWWPTDDSPA